MKALVAAVLVVLEGAALAQNAPPPPDPPGPTTPTSPPASNEGDYGGVAPGTAAREKHKMRKHGPGVVTWVGFQRVGESPRVFLRVSSRVNPAQAVVGDELVVTLPGFKLDTVNNGRPLDTRYFGTAVKRVRAVHAKGGVQLHVTFAKGAAQAKISTEPAADDPGETLVYLDF